MRQRLVLILSFLLAATWAFAEPPAGPSPEIAAILADVSKALGVAAWEQIGEIDLQGQSNYFGIDGKVKFHADRQGRFRLTITSPLGDARGWDGQSAWLGDRHGGWRRLHFRDEEAVLLTYPFLFGSWLRSPADYKYSIMPSLPENPGLRLNIRRRTGVQEVMLRLDPQTKRPLELRSKARDAEIFTTFSDYRDVDGLQVPMTMRQQIRGVGNVLRFTAATARGQVSGEHFRFTAQRPTQVRFETGAPAAVEVKRARTGHLMLRPRVNGKEVGWFILDSGAGAHAIHQRVAQELQLPAMGKVLAAGVGDTVTTQFRKAGSLELGPLQLVDQHFVEIDLGSISLLMGETIAGVLGYPLFQAAVIELDAAGPAVAVHAPQAYTLAGGQWEELRLDGNTSCVRAKFEGDHEGWFRLDTGAGNTVSFHAPAVVKFKLLDGRATTPTAEGGVGGFSSARAGSLEWFELGGKRFDRINVRFSQAERGAFMDEYLIGNIGQGLLKSFRVVFDCGMGRIALIPK